MAEQKFRDGLPTKKRHPVAAIAFQIAGFKCSTTETN